MTLKKIAKTLALILLAIVIKSICQYYLGAQETSLDKILSGLDYPFYQGCFLGGILLSFFQDNWNNIWDSLYKRITIRLDSEDDDSGNEGSKIYPKDKKGSSLDSGPETKLSKKELIEHMVLSSLAAREIGEDTKEYTQKFLTSAEELKRI